MSRPTAGTVRSRTKCSIKTPEPNRHWDRTHRAKRGNPKLRITVRCSDIVAPTLLDAALVVVGREVLPYQHARAVRVDIARHIVMLGFHVGAHLIKARGRDEVALAVDLPSDRRVRRAHCVVARRARG